MKLNSSLMVRELTIEDLDTILILEKIEIIDPSLCAKSEEQDIIKCLKSECSFAVIDNGKIAAYSLSYYTDYNTAYLDKTYVDGAYRGMGLQLMLTLKHLEALKEKGVVDIYVMVSPNNIPSMSNIEKSGFKFLRETTLDNHVRHIYKYECKQ